MSKPKPQPDGRLARLLRLGMGAFWMTEKSVRNAVRDIPLPKEAAGFLMEQIERRKAEVIDVVRGEIERAMGNLDIRRLTRELLVDHELEVTARIRFLPKK